MRTLKRTLCLALVLVMMVGLLAVGASAVTLDDYQDKDAIKHQEAVALLSALSVLQGDQGGFRPGDGLTRAEGAKIIATLLNANTTGLKSSFTDMAGHWADSFVAYCASIGIIAGYGDGRFGPNDPLTYAQFAKMLLAALGYDATREELTGNSWEIGVAKLVNQVGLSKGIADFNYGAPITRDDAAQMAFVTLTATMVGYNGNGIAVAGGNLATPRESLVNATYDYRADGIEYWIDGEWDGREYVPGHYAYYYNDGLMQFIENYFPDYKLHVDTDDYGFATHFWFKGTDRSDRTFKESKTVAKVNATRILATYTTNVALVSKDTLYKDGGFEKTTYSLPIYENGKLSENTVTPEKGSTLPGAIGQYAGAAVYLVDDTGDGVADRVLVKYALLAKVASIVKAEDSATKERQVALTVFTRNYKKTASNFDTEKYAKGDFLLVYPDMTLAYAVAADADDGYLTGKIIEVAAPEAAVGTLNKVGTSRGYASSLTVNGVAYSIGAPNIAAMGPAAGQPVAVALNKVDNYGLNKEITLYTSNGYVLGVNTTAVPYSDYVYVLGADTGKTDLITGTTSWTVAYAKQDGTTGTTKVTTNPRGVEATQTTAAIPAILGHWCAMTPLGEISLFTTATTLGAVETPLTSATLSPTSATVGAASANNKTIFVIRSGAPVVTVKAYTGISAVPTFKTAGTGMALSAPTATTASAIFLNFAANPSGTDVKPVYFVSKNYESVTQDAIGIPYYTYTAINSNGEKETLNLNANAMATLKNANGEARGLYVPTLDPNGNVTAVTPVTLVDDSTKYYPTGIGVLLRKASTTYGGDTAISAGSGVITVAGTSYAVDANAQIYIWNGRAVSPADSLEDLDGTFGHIALIRSGENKAVDTIYFYKGAAAEAQLQ